MTTRLQEARERAGLSIRGLAAACGVPPSQVSRIESGQVDIRKAGAGFVCDMARTLGVTVEWMLGEGDDG